MMDIQAEIVISVELPSPRETNLDNLAIS